MERSRWQSPNEIVGLISISTSVEQNGSNDQHVYEPVDLWFERECERNVSPLGFPATSKADFSIEEEGVYED